MFLNGSCISESCPAAYNHKTDCLECSKRSKNNLEKFERIMKDYNLSFTQMLEACRL